MIRPSASHASRLLYLLLLLSLGVFMVPGTARAAVTCSATVTSFNFGNYDPANTETTTTSTLHWTCKSNVLIGLGLESVKACFSIGTGSGGGSDPRNMIGGINSDSLQFQLYKDAAHAQIWSAYDTGNPTAVIITTSLPLLSGTSSGDVTLYGSIPGGQSAASVGQYSSTFTGTISVKSNPPILGVLQPPPDSCGTGNNGSFTFQALTTIQPMCTVIADPLLNFGAVSGFLTSNKDAESTITVSCNNGAAWKAGLNNGTHANGTQRRMRMGSSGNYIQYQLYRDSARTQIWGNTPGTNTKNGSSVGNPQTLTVYGRVPPQSAPTPGTYSDTITVTVTY